METRKKIHNSEAGESPIMFILGALVIGILIMVICNLQSCIYEHKEAKVRNRRQAEYDSHKQSVEIQRGRPNRQIEAY